MKDWLSVIISAGLLDRIARLAASLGSNPIPVASTSPSSSNTRLAALTINSARENVTVSPQ